MICLLNLRRGKESLENKTDPEILDLKTWKKSALCVRAVPIIPLITLEVNSWPCALAVIFVRKLDRMLPRSNLHEV